MWFELGLHAAASDGHEQGPSTVRSQSTLKGRFCFHVPVSRGLTSHKLCKQSDSELAGMPQGFAFSASHMGPTFQAKNVKDAQCKSIL